MLFPHSNKLSCRTHKIHSLQLEIISSENSYVEVQANKRRPRLGGMLNSTCTVEEKIIFSHVFSILHLVMSHQQLEMDSGESVYTKENRQHYTSEYVRAFFPFQRDSWQTFTSKWLSAFQKQEENKEKVLWSQKVTKKQEE